MDSVCGDRALESMPEQFYKSRIMSITLSIIAFSLSVIDSEKLANFKIFEVQVGSINQPFLVVAFLIAAFTSLISLCFSFYNEGIPYTQYRTSPLKDDAKLEAALKSAQTELNSLLEAQVQVLHLMKNPAIIAALESGLPIPSSAKADELRRAAWSEEDQRRLVEKLCSNLADIIPEDIRIQIDYSVVIMNSQNNLKEMIQRSWDEAQQRFIRLDMAVEGAQIDRIHREIRGDGRGSIGAVEELIAEFRKLRRSIFVTRWTLRGEVFWLGVALPTLIFAIAVLHGLGALGVHVFPSLPEWVAAHLTVKA